jgi:hypothetical protein
MPPQAEPWAAAVISYRLAPASTASAGKALRCRASSQASCESRQVARPDAWWAKRGDHGARLPGAPAERTNLKECLPAP